MTAANKTILAELEKFLADADFFAIYPTKMPLRRYIQDAVSDTDKIRSILRDEYVQRELFTDWQTVQDQQLDPVEHYRKNRRTA